MSCIVCADTGYTEDFLGMNAPTRCRYCSGIPQNAELEVRAQVATLTSERDDAFRKGFEACELGEPKSPKRYVEAGHALEQERRAHLETRKRLTAAQAENAELRQRLDTSEAGRCESETLLQQTGWRLSRLQEQSAKACSVWERTPNASLHDIRGAMRELRKVTGEPTSVAQKSIAAESRAATPAERRVLEACRALSYAMLQYDFTLPVVGAMLPYLELARAVLEWRHSVPVTEAKKGGKP